MALTDPVPSQAIDVFKRNMEDVDSVVNNTSGTVTNRTNTTMRPIPVIVDDLEQQINDFTSDINAAKADLYPIVKFRFLVDTYEITNRNELGDTATGETYRYVGATLPFNVTPATNPVGNSDFVQVIQTDHNNLTNRNAAGAHDASAIDYGSTSVGQHLDSLSATGSNVLVGGVAAGEIGQLVTLQAVSGSMVDRLKALCDVSNTYVSRVVEGGVSLITYGGAVNGKCFDYTMREDGDGMLLLRGGRVGEPETSNVGFSATNLNGSFVTSATNPTANYATSVGAYFDLNFTGKGLLFNHYADDRGGVWNFVIDGGAPIQISTWSSTGQIKQTLIATGLSDGFHTCRATYAGADPLNPPSSGGNGRGWFVYLTDLSAATAARIVGDFNVLSRSTALAMISPISIPEFAINVSPAGLTGTWVPQHGAASGVCRNVTRTITVDGQPVSSVVSDFDLVPTLVRSLVITHTYTAYNSNDVAGGYPLWNGVLVHKFKDGELVVTHKLTYLSDAYCAAGYYGMHPTDGRYSDFAIYNNGQKLPVDTLARTTNVIPACNSVAAYSSIGNASAFEVTSLQDALNISAGQLDDGAVFFEERVDNVAKGYWRRFHMSNLPNGKTERYQSRYFIASNIVSEAL